MIDDGNIDLVTTDAKCNKNKGFRAAETMELTSIQSIKVNHERSI
jgi:hypothetical protein